jgi:hypothetical protein
MEIPIAMIVACRLLPFRANRLANIIAGAILTLVNGFLTYVPPLVGWGRPPALPEYLFFATIETVCTSVMVWKAWTWPGVEGAVGSGSSANGKLGSLLLNYGLLRNVPERSVSGRPPAGREEQGIMAAWPPTRTRQG